MKQAFTNHGKNTVYRGGIGIPPGETRMIEAQFAYHEAEAKADDEPVADPVRELLDLKIADLEAALQNPDNNYSADFLEALGAAEEDRENRKGALAAIEEALLNVASDAADNAEKPDG